MLARKIDRPVGLDERLVGRIPALLRPMDPGAEIVGDLGPGDGDAVLDLLGIARMELGAAQGGKPVALVRLEGAEALGDGVGPDKGAEQDACAAVVAPRRIPDLRDVLVGPGNAAVDAVVLLPEAALRLEGELDRFSVARGSDGRLVCGREIGGDGPEHRERKRYDAEIRLERMEPPAPEPAIEDAHPLARAADLAHLRPQAEHGMHASL